MSILTSQPSSMVNRGVHKCTVVRSAEASGASSGRSRPTMADDESDDEFGDVVDNEKVRSWLLDSLVCPPACPLFAPLPDSILLVPARAQPGMAEAIAACQTGVAQASVSSTAAGRQMLNRALATCSHARPAVLARDH